jgi:hypothetical protein
MLLDFGRAEPIPPILIELSTADEIFRTKIVAFCRAHSGELRYRTLIAHFAWNNAEEPDCETLK